MLIIALLMVSVVLLVVHSAYRPPSELSDQAIATALGWLVRDGAVSVEAGKIQATGVALDERRGPIEARTLAAIRGVDRRSIPVDQVFAAVREARR